MELTRQYRGHEIVRKENGLMGCPGNPWPGCPTYYVIRRNGEDFMGFSTLQRAKRFIDTGLDMTDEQRERIARLKASLLNN